MGPGLRLQPKASSKKVAQSKSLVSWKWWTHPETLALIDVWGDAMADYCKSYQGKRILPSSAYEKMAKRLGENGIKRSVEQIREKIKTLKKSFWGVLAKSNGGGVTALRMNGKRQSVLDKMQRVLQANGAIVKGRSVKVETKNQQRKNKRGKKSSSAASAAAQIAATNEECEEEMEEEVLMGISIEPAHIHGSSEQWTQMNGHSPHQLTEDGHADVSYDYPLCQVLDGLIGKFLVAQRESEERFLLLEEQRRQAESKRWESVEKREEETLSKLLLTCERWREEERQQQLRLWAALATTAAAPPLDSGSQLFSNLFPPSSHHWHFTGTLAPAPNDTPTYRQP